MVELAPGETKTVTMTLTARDLSFRHEELGDWYAPSGRYEIGVGRASDEILLAAQVPFTTAKLLPLDISPAATLGELLRDPRTASAVQQMLSSIQSAMPMAASADESERAMMEAMMSGMPLKSLASFGMMNPQQVKHLIDSLKA